MARGWRRWLLTRWRCSGNWLGRVFLPYEVILEKVTNIAMGTEIDKNNEFEDIDCRHPEGRQGLELAGLLD